MKHLLFVSRVAFICNCCMFLALVMKYVQFVDNKDAQSTIIIAGFLLSFVFNLLAAAGVLILLVKKQSERIRPAWLFTVNFLSLIFQLYFMLK
jgi:hypothetical protein